MVLVCKAHTQGQHDYKLVSAVLCRQWGWECRARKQEGGSAVVPQVATGDHS
mgnify:CR=1 FL=1